MDNNKYVNIWKKVNEKKANPLNGVNTDRLKAFIKKYGVDFVCDQKYLLLYLVYMTCEQIDIIFDHKPDFSRIIKNTLNCSYILGENGPYVLQRFLEQDREFLFIEKIICIFNRRSLVYLNMRLSDLILLNMKDFGFKEHRAFMIRLLVSNHEKKYYSLFDLLKRKLLE